MSYSSIEQETEFNFDLAYPEKNILDLQVTDQEGKPCLLQTYRYPVDTTKVERKGIVFYLHGYGSHSGSSAFYTKYFADEGYEVYTMDQRGFGES
jgi:alpha-beta hydrolase superfamily lysophospholipase